MGTTRSQVFSAVSSIALLAASDALAAAPTSDNASTVQEVVVTAQKRSEKIFEVPLSVQAIGKNQLEQSGASKVADLVTAIPGASVVSDSTPGFETVQIRGIASGTTGDGLVGYYLDETPFGIPNLQLTPPAGLLDLDRVEVVRGPSGTLYGQGSMGGTIKLVTTRPSTTVMHGALTGEISGTSGGGVNGEIDGSLSLPIIKNRLAVRLSGGYDKLSGYANVPELGLKHANDFEGKNFRATVLWTPNDNFDLSAFYWLIKNRQNFSNALTPHNATTESLISTPWGPDDIAGTGGRHGYTNVDADILSLTMHWRTGIGEFTSNTSYIHHDLKFLDPLLTILANDSEFKTNSLTEEARLASLPGAPVNYIFGVAYRDATIHSYINYFEDLTPIGVPLTLPIIHIIGPLNTRSVSLFGEVSKPLFDGKLEPLAGIRYFHDDRSTVGGYDFVTGLRAGQQASYESVNPRFNLKYHLTRDGVVFVNIAKGFRSGALQTPAQAAAANATLGLPAGTIGTSIAPDSLWTYEAGTRWRLADGAVTFEASYYHTDWSHVVVQFATSAVISLANAGNAREDGVDAGVVWKPRASGWTFSANGNLNSSHFVSVVGALASATAVHVGGQLPNVPKGNFALSAAYDHPLSWWQGVSGTFYVAYAYRARQSDATTPGLESGTVNSLVIRAGLRKGPARINAFVENALDSHTPSVATVTAFEIPYPRRAGVQIGFDF
jgi:iron complex outermembrane recepter protein